MDAQPTYSLVIPVFNAEQNLALLLKQLQKVLYAILPTLEIVFVDDGSKDQSWSILQGFQQAHDYISIFKLSKNFGQFPATLCGIQQAKGQYIITFDDDLQFLPSDIMPLVAFFKANDYQIVYGMPIQKKQNWLNRLGAKVVTYYLFEKILKQKGRWQYFSSFRVLDATTARQIISSTYVDIDTYVNWYLPTSKIGFQEVAHRPRQHGQSGYHFWLKAKIVFFYLLNYFTSPLHLLLYLGVLSSFVTLTIGTMGWYYGSQSLISGIFVLLLLVSLHTASVLVGLALVAIYVSRLYKMKLGKKAYIILEQKLSKFHHANSLGEQERHGQKQS